MQQVAVYIMIGNINDNMPAISVNGSTDVEEVAVFVEEAQLTGLLVFVVEVLIIFHTCYPYIHYYTVYKEV